MRLSFFVPSRPHSRARKKFLCPFLLCFFTFSITLCHKPKMGKTFIFGQKNLHVE